jgi:hypothetical protein
MVCCPKRVTDFGEGTCLKCTCRNVVIVSILKTGRGVVVCITPPKEGLGGSWESCNTGMCALKIFCVVFQILHFTMRSGWRELMADFLLDG